MAKEKLTYPYPAKFPESTKLKLLELTQLEDRSANKILALAIDDRYVRIKMEKEGGTITSGTELDKPYQGSYKDLLQKIIKP